MKYRRRFEIIADILNAAAQNGAKKTRIMYVANLSYGLLKKYLGDALKIGLMRPNSDGYEVTEKGRVFLERYGEFSSKYSRLNREFEALKFEREVLERMCELESGRLKPKATVRRRLT